MGKESKKTNKFFGPRRGRGRGRGGTQGTYRTGPYHGGGWPQGQNQMNQSAQYQGNNMAVGPWQGNYAPAPPPVPQVSQVGVKAVLGKGNDVLEMDAVNRSQGGGRQDCFVAPAPGPPGSLMARHHDEHAIPPLIAQAKANANAREFLVHIVPINRERLSRLGRIEDNTCVDMGWNVVPARQSSSATIHGGEQRVFEVPDDEDEEGDENVGDHAMGGTVEGEKEAAEGLKALPAPSRGNKNRPKCGNCESQAHTIINCLQAGAGGKMRCCPLCNTKDHELDGCPRWKEAGDDVKLDVLVRKRGNMPEFNVTGGWYELIKKHLSEHEGELYAWRFLPWTPHFAVAKRNDLGRLQQEYDEHKTRGKLPRDPKVGTWQACQNHHEKAPIVGPASKADPVVKPDAANATDWFSDEELDAQIEAIAKGVDQLTPGFSTNTHLSSGVDVDMGELMAEKGLPEGLFEGLPEGPPETSDAEEKAESEKAESEKAESEDEGAKSDDLRD